MTDRPGDPADKATDAKADGAFGGVTNHRAGYGDDKLARLVDYLHRHPRATLASGEGAVLLAEIDRLRDDLHTQDGWVQWANGEMHALRRANKDSMDHYTDARAEIDRLRNKLKTETETVQHLIGERTADREHWGAIEDSLDRAERILAALREPSEGMMAAVLNPSVTPGRRLVVRVVLDAAVAAAEQEVGRA